MENTTIAAIITASGAVVAGAWALLKPKSKGDASSVVGNMSDSAVAVGTNITQTFAPTVHHHHHDPGSVEDASAFSGKTESKPTFAEIMADLNKERSPFEANQRYKHYSGVRICWPGAFVNVWDSHPDGRTTVRLAMSADINWDGVTFEVNLNEYPTLRVAEKGHRMWVEGTIRRISHGDIYLEDGALLTLE